MSGNAAYNGLRFCDKNSIYELQVLLTQLSTTILAFSAIGPVYETEHQNNLKQNVL